MTDDLSDSSSNDTLNVEIRTADLRSAIDAVQRTVASNPPLIAYTGVLIGATSKKFNVTASDGETTTSAAASATVRSPGKVLIAPKPLLSWLASHDGGTTLELTADGTDLLISAQGRKPYRFRGLSATFPDPQVSRAGLTETSLSGLASAVSAVRHASDETIRVRGTSDGLWLETTDYHRAAAVLLKGVDAGELVALAPLSPVVEMGKHHMTHLGLDPRGRELRAASEAVWIATRLAADPFPEVDALVAAEPSNGVNVESSQLRTALKRLAAVADGAPARLTVNNGTLLLETSNGEVGDGAETVSVDGSGSGFSCAVAVSYLSEAVAAHQVPVLQLKWSDPERPLYLVHDTDTTRLVTIVMPVRL